MRKAARPMRLLRARPVRVVLALFFTTTLAFAEPPVAKYIFPAGGQRGTTVPVRIGGCFFHGQAGLEVLGQGVRASARIRQIETLWFEGPLIFQPASQQSEDYPKDHAAEFTIAPDARIGSRYWRTWTSQGATPAMAFVVGDHPEVVEQEIEGAPVPVMVKLPVTVNGRTFPREDVDVWTFEAQAGQEITCEVHARRLGSPLDAEVEIYGPDGRQIPAQLARVGGDPRLALKVDKAGLHRMQIRDIAAGGLQHYVYRLTLTAGPHVNHFYPLGGRRGSSLRLQLTGQALQAREVDVQLPADQQGAWESQLDQGGVRTNAILLDLDDRLEVIEVEPNDRLTDAKQIDGPAILNGRIGQSGDVDRWAVQLKKGQVVELDLRAARLGSPLDSMISVLDPSGKELAQNDDLGGGQTDSRLIFTAPADASYQVAVQDRFTSRGGPEFAYRLRVGPPPAPDFRLHLPADVLTVSRPLQPPESEQGKKQPQPPAMLKIGVERIGGFSGPIELMVEGLSAGITATNLTIAEKQDAAEISFSAVPTAKIQANRIRIRGTAQIDRQKVTRIAAVQTPRGQPALDEVLLAVAMPTPFKHSGEFDTVFTPRGGTYRRRYRIDRGGYAGPLTVGLSDRQVRHLQGVRGSTITVPPGADSFEYTVSLAPWMELGRTSRSILMLSATIKDHDGSEHVVSFSSGEQADQFVTIVSAGALSVQSDQPSIMVAPGSVSNVRVQVRRAPALSDRAVKLELIVPRHVTGIHAEPQLVAADRSEAILPIRCQPGAGPFNMPLVIRATTLGGTDPQVAEAPLDFVPQAVQGETQRP